MDTLEQEHKFSHEPAHSRSPRTMSTVEVSRFVSHSHISDASSRTWQYKAQAGVTCQPRHQQSVPTSLGTNSRPAQSQTQAVIAHKTKAHADTL